VDSSGLVGLLDGRPERVLVLAPSNRGFEELLKLDAGAFDGLTSPVIQALLPSLLERISVNEEALCNLLLKHVSVIQDGRPPTKADLLRAGAITVEDGSEFPIAVGDKGTCINYESCITEPDVHTQNDIIHYLDNVIADAPSVSRVQVFVTSNEYNGNLGGMAGADGKCDQQASSAGLSGSWQAWVSFDDGTNAADRILDGEYKLVDGTVVANDKADLTDGTLDHPINMDQDGNLMDGVTVWTGTSALGTLEGETCDSWRSIAERDEGQVGNSSRADAGWTSAGEGSCSEISKHLYCFASAETDSGNEPPEDVDLENVCVRNYCSTDEDLKEYCEEFVVLCIASEPLNEEECLAAAYFICRNP
jgi:hypothetical protein